MNSNNYDHTEFEKHSQSLLESSKCYEVILSTKDRIACDADEFQRVVEGIKTGSMIKLKQGFVNPSFIVTVVLDEKRYGDFEGSVYQVLRHNRHAVDYHTGDVKGLPAFRPLKDIFAGTQLQGPIKPALKSKN